MELIGLGWKRKCKADIDDAEAAYNAVGDKFS